MSLHTPIQKTMRIYPIDTVTNTTETTEYYLYKNCIKEENVGRYRTFLLIVIENFSYLCINSLLAPAYGAYISDANDAC